MSFDFLKDKHMKIHFIGIGGISMSGLAAILLNNGYKVSGSDFKESELINTLRNKGAEVYIGHSSKNLIDVDLVVYTAAIPEDNSEIVEAKSRNIQFMDRAEFLGLIMKGHKYNVAIAGTHGKTTTTSIISQLSLEANLDPTILVGGDLDIIGGNYRIGKSDYFITEACEYKASFLKFFPYIGILLNIDADHLDYYRDIDHIAKTFEEFSNIIPEDGYLIGNGGDRRVKLILEKAKCNTISFGFNDEDIVAKDITFNEMGCGSFTVYEKGTKLFNLTLSNPGMHNILNSLSAIAVGLIFKIPYETIISGVTNSKNAHKRFEYKGKLNDVTVIDDYAHHPVEIKTTLDTARKLPHNKIYCVFQPHTYTRTKTLFKEFTEAFNDADQLILMDIYAARETDTGLVSSDDLGDAIRENGINCINLHSHDEATNYLKDNAKPGDIILTVGAGDVVIVGNKYLNN